jgi:hypothetical protein
MPPVPGRRPRTDGPDLPVGYGLRRPSRPSGSGGILRPAGRATGASWARPGIWAATCPLDRAGGLGNGSARPPGGLSSTCPGWPRVARAQGGRWRVLARGALLRALLRRVLGLPARLSGGPRFRYPGMRSRGGSDAFPSTKTPRLHHAARDLFRTVNIATMVRHARRQRIHNLGN